MAVVVSSQDREKGLLLLQKKQKDERVVQIGALVGDLKASQFFKQNWDDLLYAAPNCLELIATCQTVSVSDAASGLTLTKPLSGKWQYLDYDTLKGCLGQVTNQGRESFGVAHAGMSSIAQDCADVKLAVQRIIKALQSMDAPMSSITGNMEDLKYYSGKCQTTAKGIHTSFDLWQKVTMELWASCHNETSIVEAKQKEVESKLAFTDTYVKEQSTIVADMKERVDRMEKDLKECKQDYKDCLESFPGSGTFLGQAIAVGLTDALGSAAVVGTSIAAQSAAMTNPGYAGAQIAAAAGKFAPQSQPTVVVVGSGTTGQQTTPGAVNGSAAPAATTSTGLSKDPAAAEAARNKKETGLAKLRSAFSSSASFKKAGANKGATSGEKPTTAGDKADTEDKSKEETSKDASVETSGSTGKPKEPAAAGEKVAPPTSSSKTAAKSRALDGKFYPSDPAMTFIGTVVAQVDGVQSLVVDPGTGERGVDWSKIITPKPKPGEKAESSDAYKLKCMLERKQKSFTPDMKGLASQLTVRILEETLAVVTEMLDEAKKGAGLGSWEQPDAESELVKSWDERMTVCSDTAQEIKQAAQSGPGTMPSNFSSLFPKKTEAELNASTNLKANMADATLRAATNKLQSAQDVYKSTLSTYTGMIESNNKLKLELAKARAEVEQLRVQEVTNDNIKKVLVQCIGFLSQLKAKVGKLVEFFTSVAIFVDSICDSQVRPFEREISNMIKENPGKELMAFRYNAYLRDTIFQLTLQIFSSFDLFKDVTQMYMEVHRICIGPGLELAERCSTPAEKKLEKMTDAEKVAWDKELNERKKQLTAYVKKAEEDVRTVVQKASLFPRRRLHNMTQISQQRYTNTQISIQKQKEILSGLEQRINGIEKEIGEFPAALRPSEEQRAIMQNGSTLASSMHQEAMLLEPSLTSLMTDPDSINDDDKTASVSWD